MRHFSRILSFNVLAVLSLALVGCGLTSEEIRKATTPTLCETVTSPTSVDFSNRDILAELKKRNAAQCATQDILDARSAEHQKAQGLERERNQNDGGGGGY